MSVDPRASRAWESGAEEYEAHRPGWPPEAVSRALESLGLADDAVVVDLAAGTGKLTRVLAPRVGRVIAVEPLDDMRRRIAAAAPAAEVLEGVAQSVPVADGAADAVFVAEAFHWFANSDAVAEIARVLRPGGGVVLLWNVHEFADEAWARAAGTAVINRVEPGSVDSDRYEPAKWAPAFEGSPFEPFEHFDVRHEKHTDVDGLIGHMSTWSFVRALDEPARSELFAELRDVLRREGVDRDEVVLRYRTEAHWARRR